MQERYESVAGAVAWLKRHDIEASGQVTGTRNAAKRILAEARRHRADAIVMAADPPLALVPLQHGLGARAHRVRRMAPIPVYLVIEDQEAVGWRERGHHP